jgi:hypothetical protein
MTSYHMIRHFDMNVVLKFEYVLDEDALMLTVSGFREGSEMSSSVKKMECFVYNFYVFIVMVQICQAIRLKR